MGIGLSVTPRGTGRAVDLTSVGVGVSQVLPVLLLCLLAEPGTLVILEQPELHLHPRLETLLADFLLACARAGRQLLVETHSAHLVNRLRYHIAKDETDSTYELVGLVFAENHHGVTLELFDEKTPLIVRAKNPGGQEFTGVLVPLV